MTTRKHLFALGGGLLLGVTGVSNAETAGTPDLQTEVAALRAQVNELQGKQSQNWLNERRAEEVKALVREVLSDADTRASLLQEGMAAGHNGKNFFLASEDGNFLLNVSGQLQVRATYNHRFGANAPGLLNDDNEFGFNIPRAKVQFDGHIGSPNVLYVLRLSQNQREGVTSALDTDTGTDGNGQTGSGVGFGDLGFSGNSSDIQAEEVTVGYRVTDTFVVRVGRSKSPLLREELTSSAYQLAVDRSLVNEFFTAAYTEGVYMNWEAGDMFHVSASIDDGARSAASQFDSDATDIGVTARVDVKLAGDWNQQKDFSSWSGEEMGLFLGGAIKWDLGETGDTNSNNQTFTYTIDGSFEAGGFNAFAAAIGSHFDSEGDDDTGPFDSGTGDTDVYGLVGQLGFMIVPDKLEPFIRYEWMDLDEVAVEGSQDNVNILTVGANYYFAKHNAKAQLDVLWCIDELAVGARGLGLLPDVSNEDQIVVRAEVQLLF